MDTLIKNIYCAFGKYKLKNIKTIEPGPVSEVLYTKPLNQLSALDLWDFTFSCMMTQGDEEDFKHFLPRILEIFSAGEWDFANIVTSNFKRANWRKWEKEEQQLIETYFLTIWESKIKQYREFDNEFFVEVMLLFEDAIPLLSKWQIENSEPGLYAIIDFISNEYMEMSVENKWHIYKKLDRKYLLQISSWLKNQLPILENALNNSLINDKTLLENLMISIELIKAFSYLSEPDA